MRRFILIAFFLLTAAPLFAQQPPVPTPAEIQAALRNPPTGAEAEKLVEQLRRAFGRQQLAMGAPPRTQDLCAAWALERPSGEAAPADVRVVSEDGAFQLPLRRLGGTSLFAAAVTLPEGEAFRWQYVADGKKLASGQLEVYSTPAEMKEQPGVPKGTVTQMPPWQSKIFLGTTRDWWIYVPAQYRPENPACLMVFQDGAGARQYVPTCFDNLIHRNEMPVTVGVFINPGVLPGGGRNRSYEYDRLSDQYARFLIEEIIPEVEKKARLRQDAKARAISGSSSGGICAFTAAWERPDYFHKVLSWVGSFTNIQHGPTFREGGHNYQAMIRKAPKRDIRVFLQDGANDLDNANGNWPLANQEMAKSLAFAGYDHRFVYGKGFHSGRHGQAILPDSLRWLWRDVR